MNGVLQFRANLRNRNKCQKLWLINKIEEEGFGRGKEGPPSYNMAVNYTAHSTRGPDKKRPIKKMYKKTKTNAAECHHQYNPCPGLSVLSFSLNLSISCINC